MADVLAAPPVDPAYPALTTAVSAATRPALPVIEGGLVTTGLTLAGLYWLAHEDVDFNPMGFYADYVFPVGAILVGLFAGSGYGVMSWMKGVKIRRGLLATVVVLQLAAYASAEYIAYLDGLHKATVEAHAEGLRFEPVPFLKYFHYKTEHFAWQKDDGKGGGEPLGHGGYFFVALAALGFVGGGLIAPLVAMNLPYCEGCARYMKTRRLGIVPASVRYRKVKKTDASGLVAYEKEKSDAVALGERHGNALAAAAVANDPAGFTTAAAEAFGPTKATDKLPVRVRVDLIHCPGCARGWVRHTAVVGHGKQANSTRLTQCEVGAEFTDAVLGPSVAAG